MLTRAEGAPGALLDTHAALWLMSGDTLSDESRRAIDAAAAGSGTFVSPISAWEIGTLVRKNRIALSMSPDAWFDAMLASGVILAAMPPRTLIASAFLPGSPPSDPADRIIAATARAENLLLVTRDAQLLRYSAQGHLRALRC
jgi:PIN domain nuclease of toxin-antitoxin system